MLKLSSKLKKMQSRRFVSLIVMILLGSFTIATAGYLIRAVKKTELEDAFTLTGKYEAAIYMVDVGSEIALEKSDFIDDIGVYYELGTVSDRERVAEYRAVAYKDKQSENIYHMTCLRGAYPSNSDEVAIDLSVANTYGIPPYPGEIIELDMYNSDGDLVGSRSFTISGVFKNSASMVYGGWYRCPDGISYSMPAVFFYSDIIQEWDCNKESLFIQSSTPNLVDLEKNISTILESSGTHGLGIEINTKVSSGYLSYLGLDYNEVGTEYGEVTLSNVDQAVDKGMFKRDFFSSVILPVIALLVMVTEVVSVYMISKNIIADRREQYAILRCLGMSSQSIVKSIIAEMIGFCAVSSIIGALIAMGVHKIIIRFLNATWNLRLFDGIDVEHVVKKVTYDPIISAVLLCTISLIVSLAIPLYRLYKMYPSELLSLSDDVFVGRKRLCKKSNNSQVSHNWLKLLNKRIDLHDSSTMLVMAILMSAMLCGYVFFRAYSDETTNTPRAFMDMLGIDGDGYVAERSIKGDNWRYNVFNRHDAGIPPDVFYSIENDSNVAEARAVILNESTRLVFTEEPNSDMKELLNYRIINIPESMDFYEVNKTGEDLIFERMGYAPDTFMYELPTVGLTPNELSALESEVIAGQINQEKILSGEEVVLAVPEELADLCLRYYPIGSEISFDDIVLTEEEENLDLSNIEDEKWGVFETYVEAYGEEIYVRYDAVGTRYELHSVVGAIVVLHDEQDKEDYLSSGSFWSVGLQLERRNLNYSYGMSILCLDSTFSNWGLPDQNFTKVRVSLTDHADIYEFDKTWYQMISRCTGITTKTTFEYHDEINTKTMRVMAEFYVLIIALIVLGMASVILGLYTKTRGNSERFQLLRRMGLSVTQASEMMYTQNAFYPFLSIVVAVIPVYLIQTMFNTINGKLMSGELRATVTGSNRLPWYMLLPITKNLFSYNFITALIVCFVIGVLLIVIGTLPQIMYLKKMKMIAEKEE